MANKRLAFIAEGEYEEIPTDKDPSYYPVGSYLYGEVGPSHQWFIVNKTMGNNLYAITDEEVPRWARMALLIFS